MDEQLLQQAAEFFGKEYQLEAEQLVSEEKIIAALERSLSLLLEKEPEAFFQLMYRLDISEKKLNEAMKSPEAMSLVAKLVYERQLQKIRSRMEYRDDRKDDELSW